MAATGYQKDFILYDLNHESVRVTGTWCGWDENAHKLTKIPNLYWIASVYLPYGEKVLYKYIIDGEWRVNPGEDQENDERGLANNVFHVPKQSDLPSGLVGSTSSTSAEPIKEVPAGETVPTGPIVATSDHATGSSSAPVQAKSTLAGSTGTAATDAIKAHSSGSPTIGTETNAGLTALGAGVAGVGIGAGIGGVTRSTDDKAASKIVTGSTASGDAASTTVDPTTGTATATTASVTSGPSATASTASKAPLPAPTKDAPRAPSSLPAAPASQGFFSAIGNLAASAVATLEQAAESVVEKIEGVASSPTTKDTLPLPATAKGPTSASGTTTPVSTGSGAKAVDGKAALAPIASADSTAAVQKEMSKVTLQDTKQEVTSAVEKLGAALTSGVATLGLTNTGEATSATSSAISSAKSISPPSLATATLVPDSSSTANTPALETSKMSSAPQLPPVVGHSGPLYPADGTAPAPIKIAEPAKDTSAVKTSPAAAVTSAPAPAASASKSGSSAPSGVAKVVEKVKDAVTSSSSKDSKSVAGEALAAPSNSTAAQPAVAPASAIAPVAEKTTSKKSGEGIADKLKRRVSRAEEKKPPASGVTPVIPNGTTTASTVPTSAVPATTKTPTSSVSKKDASALGHGQAPSSASPVTPKKTADGTTAATPATGTSDKYATAPTTPATPAGTERKRKSSFFQKVKSAFSPNK